MNISKNKIICGEAIKVLVYTTTISKPYHFFGVLNHFIILLLCWKCVTRICDKIIKKGAIMGYNNKNHDTHLFCVLNLKLMTYENECFKMLNNERGICMFRLSTNKCIMIDSNQLNKIWMFCSSINQKGMHDYLNIPEWHTFIWSAKTRLKNQIMSFFCTHISYTSFQTFGMQIFN